NGAKIHFSVADEGEGIEPEQIAIIFDAYKRAESRAGGGTGLGLTLSRKLAVLLGGDISVQSSLGKGSVFTVTVAQTMVDGDTNS
ncbi:MAG: ATP-binding protein, partial [Gemmatimonadota bacterium]|nr:ATP-binding protein [Gemmatimonadota bacterium]